MAQSSDVNSDPPRISYVHTPGLPRMLSELGASLLVSCNRAGVLALFTSNGSQLSLSLAAAPSPMGLAAEDGRVGLACRNSVSIRNVVEPLTPTFTWDAPNAFCHDVAFVDDGLLFVDTNHSLLRILDSDGQISNYWQPAFVSSCLPEDRCHLNGVDVAPNGEIYVTAFATSNTLHGWRTAPPGSGVVVRASDDAVIADGLHMPHSPRIHDGRIWLLESARSALVVIDENGRRDVGYAPGFLRGLAFLGDHAVIGLSRRRPKANQQAYSLEQDKWRCGVALVNQQSGQVDEFLQFTSGIDEIFDVLPIL